MELLVTTITTCGRTKAVEGYLNIAMNVSIFLTLNWYIKFNKNRQVQSVQF